MKIFSGIQPTGKLHIGNYFGAIQNMVRLQDKGEAIFSIVDLHAITIKYDPKSFQQKLKDTVLDFLACGIDPEKSVVFIQSQVKEHAELAYLLSAITPIGQLQRMTQFKDKSQKEKTVNTALLIYPILMAADILLYDTNIVPIGEDQKQHLELTQDIVRRFNYQFGEVLGLPKIIIPQDGARIMSLTNPLRKMSKSEPEGCIFLTDEPEAIKDKIKKAITDTERKINFVPNRPVLANLITIYGLCENKKIGELNFDKFDGHAQFKEALAASLIKKLELIRKKRGELEQKPEYIKKVLEEGRKKAQKIASKKIEEVKKAMGLT
ncbi:tryptophan--tRNA ligase [bacterium]|nr:MAG: tryptophan--tRNA ligase [bacterium]